MNYYTNIYFLFAIIVSSVNAQKIYFDSQFPPAPGRRTSAIANGNGFRRTVSAQARNGDRFQSAQMEDNSLDTDVPAETEAPTYIDSPFSPITPSVDEGDGDFMKFKFGTTTIGSKTPAKTNGFTNGFGMKKVDETKMPFRPMTPSTRVETDDTRKTFRPMTPSTRLEPDDTRKTFRPTTATTRVETDDVRKPFRPTSGPTREDIEDDTRTMTGVGVDTDTADIEGGADVPSEGEGPSVEGEMPKEDVGVTFAKEEEDKKKTEEAIDAGEDDNAIDSPTRKPDVSVNGIRGPIRDGIDRPGMKSGIDESGHYDGHDHDHDGDPIDWLRKAIRGEPGVDYPIYGTIIKTSFLCSNQRYPGYYADVEARCQIFHICQADGRADAFLCPNGTIFSQRNFVCVWWNQFDCSTSETYYELNADLYTEVAMKKKVDETLPRPVQPRPTPGIDVDERTPSVSTEKSTDEEGLINGLEKDQDMMKGVEIPEDKSKMTGATAVTGVNGSGVTTVTGVTGVTDASRKSTTDKGVTIDKGMPITEGDREEVPERTPEKDQTGPVTDGVDEEKVTDDGKVIIDDMKKADEEMKSTKDEAAGTVTDIDDGGMDIADKVTEKPQIVDDKKVPDDEQQEVQVYEDSQSRRQSPTRSFTRFFDSGNRTPSRSVNRLRFASHSPNSYSSSQSSPSSFSRRSNTRNQGNSNRLHNGRRRNTERLIKRKGSLTTRNGRARP